MHDRFQDFVDANSHLCARIDRLLCRNGEDFLELSMDRRNICVRQIDLVDHRHNR